MKSRNKAGQQAVRPALIAVLLAGTALGNFATQPVLAQAPAATSAAIDIPAQALSSALIAFSRQTRIEIFVPSSLAAGKRSGAVSGAQSPEAALQRLLAGTGLTYRFTGARSVTVEAVPAAAAIGAAPAGAIALDTIDVMGASMARGGVSEIVIGPKEIERKNPIDTRDLFAGEPGVKVGGSIPMSQKVYVHGVEENNLSVTIDGSRQNNKVFHHNGTTLIDPSFLKAARVDAGVAPADAGPGAMAGAIAYETKDARDFLPGNGVGAFAKTVFNTNGNVFTNSLSGYARYQGFDALGYVTYGKGQAYEAGDGRKVPGTATDILSGLVKLGWEAPSGDRFQISHERVRDDALRPFRGNIGFISGRPAWEPRIRNYEINRQNTVLSYSRTSPIGLWDPKAVLAYSATEVRTPVFERPIGANPPVTYPGTGETDSLNGKFENRFGLGSLGSVTAGVDFYKDKALYKDINYRISEKASNVGVYAQARLTPIERVRVSFGLRGDKQWFTGVDRSSHDNFGVSRNASAEVDLIPELLTAKAGYSHVFGGVQLAENFILNPAWRYGRYGVEPTTSDNYVAGLVARYAGFTVEGSVFRTVIDNARSARFALAAATQTRHVESHGYEISAAYAWADGFVRAKYADIDVKIDNLPADSDTGTYLATPIGRVLTLTGAHTFQQWGVTVGADLEIVFDYTKVLPGNLPLKGYEVVNAFVEYKPQALPNFTFRVEAKNILDKTYADRATYGQEFGTVTPLYQPGRAIVLSAAARF